MSGDLAQVSLASLLAFAEAERRQVRVTVRQRQRHAVISIRGGVIVGIDVPSEPKMPLLERLMRVLDWTEGRFIVEETMVIPGPESVRVGAALMEHAHRKDESERL